VLFSFVRDLPNSVLSSNLSAIVVAVLPALTEDDSDTSSNSSATTAAAATASAAISGDGGATRRAGIALLHHLIVGKRNSLRRHFKTVPFVPAIPELSAVTEALVAEVSYMLVCLLLLQMLIQNILLDVYIFL
jgi:hypothetical protein